MVPPQLKLALTHPAMSIKLLQTFAHMTNLFVPMVNAFQKNMNAIWIMIVKTLRRNYLLTHQKLIPQDVKINYVAQIPQIV